MINVDYFTRKPISRIVDYMFISERDHLIEGYIPDDMTADVEDYTDDELFQYCVNNDIDHIWLDVYLLKELINEDEE